MASPQTPQDAIAAARRGDREAFDRLAAACRDRLLAIIRFRLGPSLRREVDAEDVLQETLLRAFDAIERFTPKHDDSFFHWLSGIVRNIILEHGRQARPATGVEADEVLADSTSPSRSLQREERLARLQRALDALQPDYRRVLRGVLVERLPLTEIAHRMGRTPNAVSLLLLRANRKLRERFGDTQSLGLPAAELDWGENDEAE